MISYEILQLTLSYLVNRVLATIAISDSLKNTQK